MQISCNESCLNGLELCHAFGWPINLFIYLLLFFLLHCRIAECFAFLVCTKWSNPVIHRNSQAREASSSSTSIRYLDWNSGLVVSAEEDQDQDRLCGLQDIGGHIMKIPVIGFQILLCMHLEVSYVWVLLILWMWNLIVDAADVASNFREPRLVQRKYHFRFSSLPFSYSKVLVY